MSAVTQIIYSFLLLLVLANLSACSDETGTNVSESDNRQSNLDTPFTIVEGIDGDQTNLEITFTPDFTGTIVYETFNVTAAEKSDYTPIAGELEVIEGTEYTFEIVILGDDEIEGNELVGLQLTHNGEEIAPLYGLIVNDDLPPITISTTTVLEGDTGTSLLRFTFELQEEIVDPYTFLISTPEENTENNDPDNGVFYAIPDEDFKSVSESITFTDDEPEVSIDVVIYADNVIELDERVKIVATAFDDQGQTEITATGIIRTDDSIDTDGFDLSATSGSQDEGSSEDVDNITWNPVGYTVTVDYPENIIEGQTIQIVLEGSDVNLDEEGWATPGIDQDYCSNNPIEENEQGETECNTVINYQLEPETKTFDISFYVRADLDVESGTEDIKVSLQNDQGITFGEFFHAVKEDDYPVIMVTYNANGAESDTTLTFEEVIQQGISVQETSGDSSLTLALNLQFPQSINYSFDYELSNDESTTVDSSDYSIPNDQNKKATVTIEPGVKEGVQLDVSIDNDDDYEGEERLSLEIDGIGVIPITIIDNDLPELILTSPSGEEFEIDSDNFAAIKIDEQENAATDLPGAALIHDFDVVLANNASALSALNFSYFIDNDFFTDQSNIDHLEALSSVDCTYLFESDTKRQAFYASSLDPLNDLNDYSILINGEPVDPEESVELAIGNSSLRVQIQVNDDASVECAEFLSLGFLLEPVDTTQDISSTLEKQFEITNKDKTSLNVNGWQVSEGGQLGSPSATTDENFTLSLAQPLVSSITYELSGSDSDVHSCSANDISNLTASTDVFFSGQAADVTKSISVNISHDSTVEPNEACTLTITGQSTDLMDITYFNESGIDTGTYEEVGQGLDQEATGVIHNDDEASLSLQQQATTCDDASEIYENCEITYTLSSSNDIAQNIDDINIDFSFSGIAKNSADDDYSFFPTLDTLNLLSDASTYLVKEADSEFLASTLVSFTQELHEDNQLEIEESFNISISMTDPVTGVVISNSNNQVTGQISENGGALQVVLHYDSSIKEGLALPSPDTRYPFEITTNMAVGEEVEDIYLDVSKLDCKDGDLYCSTLLEDLIIDSDIFYIHEFGNNTEIKTSGDLPYEKLEVVPEDMLEKDENLELEFSLIGGGSIPKNLYLNDSLDGDDTQQVSLIIENDDYLTVTISQESADNSSNEKNTSDLIPNTVQYKALMSTSVAANYPSITVIATDPSEVSDGATNYAKIIDSDYSFASLVLHDGIDATSQGEIDIEMSITPDDRLETDELITAGISLSDSSTFITLDTVKGLSSFTHTLNNDDELVLEISKQAVSLTMDEGDLAGDDKSETDIIYNILTPINIAPNFPNISLVSAPSLLINNAKSGEDYRLSLPVIHTQNTGLIDTASGTQSFNLTVYGEDILEPYEQVTETISVQTIGSDVSIHSAGTDITSLQLGNVISYGINNDDQLTLSITKNETGSTSSEGDPLAENTIIDFSVTLSTAIGSNYPSISLQTTSSDDASDAKETDDFNIDYSELHSHNTDVSGVDTSAGTNAITLEIIGDETLEPNELIDITFTSEIDDSTALTFQTNDVLLENSAGVISTSAIGEKTAGGLIRHTINNDDDLRITITAPATLEVNEGDNSAVTTGVEYTVALSNPIAANYDDISLVSSIQGSNSAESSDDYTIELPDIHDQDLSEGAIDTAATDLTLKLKIKGDTTLELDETIDLLITESVDDDNVTFGGSGSYALNYEILNDDRLTVTVTPSANTASNEGNDSVEDQKRTYTVDTDIAISSDYPAFDLTFSSNNCATDCATVTTDYIFSTDAIEIHTGLSETSSGATFDSKVFEIVEDTVVEKSELFQSTLGFSLAGIEDVEVNFNATGTATLQHTITNDDFIEINFNNGSNLNEGDEVTFTVLPYESSGLTDTEIKQELAIADNNSFSASGLSSDIGSITLPAHSIVASLATASTGTLFSIEDDFTIEPGETFTLPIDLSAHSDYVRVQASGSSAQDIIYTIEDDDKLYVELEKFHTEDISGTAQSYYMNVCYSINPTVEGANANITPTMTAISSAGSGVLTTKAIDTAVDLTGIQTSVELDLKSGFALSGSQYCQQTELFKTVADTTVEGTEWINVELTWPSTADSRFTTTNFAGGGIDVAVIDNDFPHMTQTGASKCIDSSGDGYLRTNTSDCYGSGAADSRPKQDYTRAEQSNGTHPSQHFTLIANGFNSSIPELNGEPSNNAPSQLGNTFNGDNGYCLFDSHSNNVWLIGGFNFDTNLSILSTDRIPFSSTVDTDKTALTLQADAQGRLSWCGMTSDDDYQWRLPTVDELLTTLNIEHLRGATEMSSDTDVVLTSYFQNHFADSEETLNDLNATQGDCELDASTECVVSDIASTISSYYWTSEYCLEADAIASSVDAGQKREAATVAGQAYEDMLAENDVTPETYTVIELQQANEFAQTAENDAAAAELTAKTSIGNQIEALAVDFASGQLKCLNKTTGTAHVRLVYK